LYTIHIKFVKHNGDVTLKNSVNLTCMGFDRCQIMKYSGLSDNTVVQAP